MVVRCSIATAAMLAAAVVLTLACSSSLAPTPTGASAQGPWQKNALWVEQGDNTQLFENGTAVTVGEVNAEVFVAPYPPSREGSIDLYITDKATGQPVEAEGVTINFDMYMPHGTISAEALSMGGGHYLVPYKLVMPGEWRVDITISQSRDVAVFALIFRTN